MTPSVLAITTQLLAFSATPESLVLENFFFKIYAENIQRQTHLIPVSIHHMIVKFCSSRMF